MCQHVIHSGMTSAYDYGTYNISPVFGEIPRAGTELDWIQTWTGQALGKDWMDPLAFGGLSTMGCPNPKQKCFDFQ